MPKTTNDNKSDQTSRPRVMQGVVVSDKNDKTVTVEVTAFKVHPKYKKRYRVTRKFAAHDADNTFKVGERVTLTEHAPFSKSKRWVAGKATT